MKVLIVRPISDEVTAEMVDVDVNLEWLQKTVGGNIELVSSGSFASWNAYCNEEGKLLRLPVNETATLFAEELGWLGIGDVLVGNVVFLGPADNFGEDTAVPEWLLEQFFRNR